jgi:hypothetical protein
MKALEVALAFAKKGLPVLRLMPRSKDPVPGSHGHKDATTDRATLTKWFSRSDFNLGLAPPPGYIVLDTDSQEGEVALAEALGGAIPPTLSWHSGRKEHDGFRGIHRLYEVPEGVELKSGTLIPGALDMKGGGTGYVVVPPSIHPNGRPYEFRSAESPIATLSVEHAEAIAAIGGKANGGPAPPLPKTIPAGNRNNTLASMAGTLRRRNFSREAALAALLEENQLRCDPPLDKDEVERVRDSIYRNYAPGTYDEIIPAEDEFEPIDDEVAPQDAHFGESGTSPPFLTLGELRENPDLLKRPPPLSRWLAWPGELTLLVGREKLGKSTLAAHDAVHAAHDGYKVLWVSFEEGLDRIVSRFVDLDAPDDEMVIVTLPLPSYQRFDEIVSQARPDLVYVDSGASYVGATESRIPDSGQGEQWQRIYLALKKLAMEYRCGVVVLVHANKSDGRLRGSTGIGAAADTILTMRPVKNPESSNRTMDVVGRWERRTLYLTMTEKDGEERYEEVGAADPNEEFDVDPRERIRAYLTDSPGAFAGDIEELPGRREVRAALRKMTKDGEVQIKTGKRGAKHHYLVE